MFAATTAAMPAYGRQADPPLAWRACGNGAECARVSVRRDYARPDERTFSIALARLPATDHDHRTGSLFLNPGGPGASGTEMLLGLVADGPLTTGAFAALNRRFDLVGFDPRGVGESRPAVQCLTDAEAREHFAFGFPTPDALDVGSLLDWAQRWVNACVTRNRGVLPYMSTGNAARDLDRLRAAVGDERLSYLGFSYGTQLGATYASLFPSRVRALVLDGGVDLNTWIFRPIEATREEAVAFEHALSRFFACAASGDPACAFTDDDPETAYDELVERLDRNPIQGWPGDPRPVTGDTVRVATDEALYQRSDWLLLAAALENALAGNGNLVRDLADDQEGFHDHGPYDHAPDRLLVISALDQRNPRGVGVYLRSSLDTFSLAPHFWWGSGYLDLPWGLFPVHPNGAFVGPFALASQDPPALVIGTTYDPATPYVWSKRLTAQLGNARLLTMVGDGHTAFGDNSTCIDAAVLRYLESLALPPEGTRCRQESRLLNSSRRATAASLNRGASR